MSLLIHTAGGRYITLEELKDIPLPQKTETYQPVSHYDLAVNLANVARDLLTDYNYYKSRFGIARHGNQMFGIHTFSSNNDSLGLTIGFRNSYDKSMSVGIAIGATVFCMR